MPPAVTRTGTYLKQRHFISFHFTLLSDNRFVLYGCEMCPLILSERILQAFINKLIRKIRVFVLAVLNLQVLLQHLSKLICLVFKITY